MSNDPTTTSAPLLVRSDRFVLSAQLEAFCMALRLAVQVKAEPGATTIELLSKLRMDLNSIVQGRCKVGLPEVANESSAVEVLALAETLRGTILAFLTPDESEEQKAWAGFGSTR